MTSDADVERPRRHVVWDWNGTLLDDRASIVLANQLALTRCGLGGVDPDRLARIRHRSTADFYAQLVGRTLDPQELEQVLDAFEVAYDEVVAGFGLAAGAGDALTWWPSSGPPERTQSLLSLERHDQLVRHVARLTPEAAFVLVEGRPADHRDGKVRLLVDHVGRLLASLPGLTADDVLLIGDARDDAVAAAGAGIRCILHTGGFAGFAQLQGAGAPVVASVREAVEAAVAWAAHGRLTVAAGGAPCQ